MSNNGCASTICCNGNPLRWRNLRREELTGRVCLARPNCFTVNAPQMWYSLSGSVAGQMVNETPASRITCSSCCTVLRVMCSDCPLSPSSCAAAWRRTVFCDPSSRIANSSMVLSPFLNRTLLSFKRPLCPAASLSTLSLVAGAFDCAPMPRSKTTVLLYICAEKNSGCPDSLLKLLSLVSTLCQELLP